MVQGTTGVSPPTNSISASLGVRLPHNSSDPLVRNEVERYNTLKTLQNELMCLRLKHMQVMRENEQLIAKLYTSDSSESEEQESNISDHMSDHLSDHSSDIEEELDAWKMQLLR